MDIADKFQKAGQPFGAPLLPFTSDGAARLCWSMVWEGYVRLCKVTEVNCQSLEFPLSLYTLAEDMRQQPLPHFLCLSLNYDLDSDRSIEWCGGRERTYLYSCSSVMLEQHSFVSINSISPQ